MPQPHFYLLLHYTNNVTFTYYHCEKGIYYFTEFISQIENENSFLKLSSIDAIIFVYKKTIYNINKKMAIQTARDFISHANEIIKTITNINSINKYSIIAHYFTKIANLSPEKLVALQKSVNHLEDIKILCKNLKKYYDVLNNMSTTQRISRELTHSE